MPKRKTHPATPAKRADAGLHLSIDVRAIERKIRKPLPPPVKVHRSDKAYQRKVKHPKRDDE